MPQREIKLDTAAFLDSTQAKALTDLRRDHVKMIVDRFLACSYDEIGKAPRFLDGEDVHVIVGHLLPGHFARKDPLAAHALVVLRAYFDFLVENAVVTQIFEMRHALERTAGEFESAVATGSVAHHAPAVRRHPDEFVPRNPAERVIAARPLDVGVADARRDDANESLAGGFRSRHIAKRQSVVFEPEREHGQEFTSRRLVCRGDA